VHLFRGTTSRALPPVIERVLTVRREAGYAQPCQSFVPDLAGERAFQHEVMDCFRSLVAEWASCWVLQPAARQSISLPTSGKVCQPLEEPYFRRRPCPPCKLPVRASDCAMEGCKVGRVRGVFSIRGPFPMELVRLFSKNGALDQVPELEILSNLL
jgi:hypothetical protein